MTRARVVTTAPALLTGWVPSGLPGRFAFRGVLSGVSCYWLIKQI